MAWYARCVKQSGSDPFVHVPVSVSDEGSDAAVDLGVRYDVGVADAAMSDSAPTRGVRVKDLAGLLVLLAGRARLTKAHES